MPVRVPSAARWNADGPKGAGGARPKGGAQAPSKTAVHVAGRGRVWPPGVASGDRDSESCPRASLNTPPHTHTHTLTSAGTWRGRGPAGGGTRRRSGACFAWRARSRGGCCTGGEHSDLVALPLKNRLTVPLKIRYVVPLKICVAWRARWRGGRCTGADVVARDGRLKCVERQRGRQEAGLVDVDGCLLATDRGGGSSTKRAPFVSALWPSGARPGREAHALCCVAGALRGRWTAGGSTPRRSGGCSGWRARWRGGCCTGIVGKGTNRSEGSIFSGLWRKASQN